MTIDFKGHRLEIDANISGGNDGDYWTPPTPPQVEIENVYYNGTDITDLFLDLLSINDLTKLEELIVESEG